MRIATLLAAALIAGTAAAQDLDVEFAGRADGQAAGCPGARVTGLNPRGDGFLAVRTGPGTNFAKIDELYNGMSVRACAKRGAWWGVLYDDDRRGWVHGNWLGEWAG